MPSETNSRIGPTKIGTPSMMGYSRWHSGFVHCRMPSRTESSVRTSSDWMTSEWAVATSLCRHSGQTGSSCSKWASLTLHPPIMTVGQPGGKIFPTGDGIGATQLACSVMSLIRAAGSIPMSTLVEAFMTIPGPAGTHPGNMQGIVVSVIRAAGNIPIITLG